MRTQVSNPSDTPEPSAPSTSKGFWNAERVAQSVRSVSLLGITGASLALGVAQVAGRNRWLDGFLQQNTLPLPARHQLLVAMATAAFVAASPIGFVIARRNPYELDQVRRLALFLSPLAFFGVLVPLFRLDPWVDQPLLLGCAAAITIVGLERTVSQSLEAAPGWLVTGWAQLASWLTRHLSTLARVLPILAVTAGALAYGVFVAIMTIRYHHRLGTAAFDLGGYDNIFYNALKGRPLRGTVAVPSGENWSSLRTHAEFSVYALLPFYAIRPRAEALLCIQAFVVGMGAIPIYLLAARRIPAWSAVILASAYLLFAPVQAGNFYDFHFQPIASTLVLFCFYFIDTKRTWLTVLFFVVALGCREDVSISLAVAGAIMVATGYRSVTGAVMAIVSGVYFLVVRFVVMPHFGSWWFQDMYKDLLPAGDASLFGVLKTVASNPIYTLGTLLTLNKVLHVLRIFLPLAFLPLRRPSLWLGFVPAILTTILTTGYHPTTDTTFQYVFYWVPFIFVGAALTLERLLNEEGLRRHMAAVVALAMATVLTSFHWGAVFQRKTFASAWGRIDLEPLSAQEWETLHDLDELGRMVPPQASLATSEYETAHLSNRLSIYTLKTGTGDADYILYRKGSGWAGSDRAAQALASGRYKVMATRGKFELLVRVPGK